MGKSTQTMREKPAKPSDDFPLFPHGSGQWAKVIRGKTHYFGSWANPSAAEEKYLEVAEDLHAGRTPVPKAGNDPTVRDVANAFIKAKRKKLDNGKLSPRTFIDYDATCKLLVKELGNHAVRHLTPTDFTKLHDKLSGNYSSESMRGMITQIRGVFKYAAGQDLIAKVPKYGEDFVIPDQKELRMERAENERKHGKRMFEPEELRKVLAAASPPLKAMTLLALNGGLGNSDLSEMPMSVIDLKTGWCDYPRVKTAVPRRFPLWPETLAAVKEVLAQRKPPENPEYANRLFLTKFSQPWVRFDVVDETNHGKKTVKAKQDDAISKGFNKLLKELGLKRAGLSFYTCRHVFATIAGDAVDQTACDLVMGHADPKVGARYRHSISDDRLRNVVNHVRTWLFEEPKSVALCE